MITLGNFIFMVIDLFIPNTRGFHFRARLLRLLGHQIGANVRIGRGLKLYCNQRITIGDDSFLSHDITVSGNARFSIGKCVDVAPGVSFYMGSHSIGNTLRRAGNGFSRDIVVGDGTWLCAEVLILGGVIIGKGVVVSAREIIGFDLPDNCGYKSSKGVWNLR